MKSLVGLILLFSMSIALAQDNCFQRALREESIGAIGTKVWFGNTRDTPFSYLANSEKVSNDEKPFLEKYANIRQRCVQETITRNQGNSLNAQFLAAHQSEMMAMVRLYNGEITFGAYASDRLKAYQEFDGAVNAMRQAERAAAEAKNEANRAALLQMYLNRPQYQYQAPPVQTYTPPLIQPLKAPQVTTCQFLYGTMRCTTN